MAALDLTPPECGVLGILSGRPGMSQQQLSETLGMIPSRVVPLVDGLEDAGLVQRARDDTDRRRNALQLTDAGRRALTAIGRVGAGARRRDHLRARARPSASSCTRCWRGSPTTAG